MAADEAAVFRVRRQHEDAWLRTADVLDLAFTFASCALYVLGTYVEGTPHSKRFGIFMWQLEIALSGGLLVLYTLRLWTARNHGRHVLEYMLAPSAILDLGTSLPVVLALIVLRDVERSRPVRILRILRVLRTFHLSSESQLSPAAQQATVVGLTLLSVVFISACFFPLLEMPQDSGVADAQEDGDFESIEGYEDLVWPYKEFPFHDALYFVIITITTVGYGDISPLTPQGRLASVLMVGATFVLLPLQTSKLIELLSTRDPFASRFRGSFRRPHVLICGKVTSHTLRHFEEQLLSTALSPLGSPRRYAASPIWELLRFRNTRKSSNRREHTAEVKEMLAWMGGGVGSFDAAWELQLVVLSQSAPDDKCRVLLQSQRSPKRLHWLRGSAASATDLMRADLEHALAAIVLSDERPASSHADCDTRAVLDALSLRYRQPQLPCIVDLKHHPQAGHLRLLGTRCVVESGPLRMLVLAISCTCTGATALLYNLLQQSTPYATLTNPESLEPWQHEYLYGSEQRLQKLPVPKALEGCLPAEAVARAFAEAGAVLLARAPTAESCHAGRLELLCASERPLVKGEVLFAIRAREGSGAAHGAVTPSDESHGHRKAVGRSGSRSNLIPSSLSIASAFSAATRFVTLPRRQNVVDHDEAAATRYHCMGEPDSAEDGAGEHVFCFCPTVERVERERLSSSSVSSAATSAPKGRRIMGKRLALIDDPSAATQSAPTLHSLLSPAAAPEAASPAGRHTTQPSSTSTPAKSRASPTKAHTDLARDIEAAFTQRRGAFHIPSKQLHRNNYESYSPASKLPRPASILPRPDSLIGLAAYGKACADYSSTSSACSGLRHQHSAAGAEEGSGSANEQGGSDAPSLTAAPAAAVNVQRLPSTLSSAPAHTVDDDPPAISPPPVGLNSHVILCGLPAYTGALRDFVAPLRCKARYVAAEACPPVLLLQPTTPPPDACRAAAALGDVYYLQGHHEDMADMLRAGIDHASHVVLPRLNDNGSGIARSEDHHTVYEDAATILTCREIESAPELMALPIAEVAYASNMDFLMPHTSSGRNARTHRPTPTSLSPYFAAGRVLAPRFVTSLLCHSVRHFHIPDLLEELLVGASGHGCLLQWPVPAGLVDHTYGELFDSFVRELAAVPLGLMRGGTAIGSPLPYVFTNPPASTRLLSDDLVFVVGKPQMEPDAPSSDDDDEEVARSESTRAHGAKRLRAAFSMPFLPPGMLLPPLPPSPTSPVAPPLDMPPAEAPQA